MKISELKLKMSWFAHYFFVLKWDPLRYNMMSNKVFYFEMSPICTLPGWNWHISLPLRWFPLSIWQTWLDKGTGTTTTDQKKRALTKGCPDTTFD